MKIAIAGATGQVGTELLKLLANSEHSVLALVRKPNSITVKANNISEMVFNYESLSMEESFRQMNPDILICALGTTMRKAGSVQRFNRVDRDYPIKLIQILKAQNPQATFALVSSVGADHPRGVYLKAKFAVEEELKKSGLKYIIARPSFLISNRKEIRPAEIIVDKLLSKPYLAFAKKLAPKSEAVWKYAPVPVENVAKTIIKNLGTGQNFIAEGLAFY